MFNILLCFIISLVSGDLVGPVTIIEDGKPVTRYVISTAPELASTDGSKVVIKHNGAVFISSNATDDYYPNMYTEYKLYGKTVSYIADLSNISCSCNMALFFTTMPAIGSNGQPIGGKTGDYSCDANDGNGELCWEMDVMEANKYVSATTPHTCNSPPGTYITSCDGAGCGTNAHNINSNGMCNSNNCLINTQNPFNFTMHFGDTMHVKMIQGTNVFEFDTCSNDENYVKNMTQALDYGMVMILCYWGDTYDTMKWLDGNTGCTGDCDTNGLAVFSDIRIE